MPDQKRILILGGAGYIGRTMLGLYSLEPQNRAITVVDKAVVPGAVEQCKAMGARYVVGDIGNTALMGSLIIEEEPDIVFLLAGQIEAESSGDREAIVWEENYDKACGIVRLCELAWNRPRLMFPSSANVFGGNKEPEDRVFTEADDPQPMFPYAQTKAAMEQVIRKSDTAYTIARLGTNYGWGPGIRFNLVVNLFTLRAVRGLPLRVFGLGNNYRPFVHNRDCARAFIFLSEHSDAVGRLFHVVENSYQIGQIAENVGCVCACDEIDYLCYREQVFSSYRMSAVPLRDLGYSFEFGLRSGIEDLAGRLDPLRRPQE